MAVRYEIVSDFIAEHGDNEIIAELNDDVELLDYIVEQLNVTESEERYLDMQTIYEIRTEFFDEHDREDDPDRDDFSNR